MLDPLLDVDVAARTVSVRAEPEPPTVTDRLADMTQIGEFLFKLSLVVGFASVFSYLTFSISFFPAGMTLADTFLFLEACLAFALGYAVFAGAGYLLACLIHLDRLLGPGNTVHKAVKVVTLVCFGGLYMFLESKTEWATHLGQVFAGLLFTGWVLQLLVAQLDGRQSLSAAVLFGALCTSLMASQAVLYQINVNYAMPLIGLRTLDATLRLSEENYKILSGAVGGQELAVLGCDAVPGSSEKLVHGMAVLWNGIGERTLIGIPSYRGDNGATKDSLKVELQRDGVHLLKNYKGVRERCVDLSGELLFKSGSAIIDPANDEDLDRVIKILSQAQTEISEIQVTGHSDPIAYGKSAALNDALAHKRATAVAERIGEKTCTSLAKFKIDAKGAREPKTLCKDWPVKSTLGECLAVNRRVEVRMKFREQTTPAAGE